nr:ABC transporter permease subunit [Xanthomonas hortorum]
MSIGVSLGAALLLNAKASRFKAVFRTALFAPVVTTLVAVAVIWRYLFHIKYGLVNFGLSHLGIAPIDWLGDPRWAMPTIMLFAVWKNFGYNMVIFLAGLQAIPQDLYEAARIDGASEMRIFFQIVLPMLKPVLVTLTIFTFMGSWNDFMWPLIVLTDQEQYTLPVALAALSREHIMDVELMMAGAVVTVIPVLLLFIALQRYYIQGLLLGSVKG